MPVRNAARGGDAAGFRGGPGGALGNCMRAGILAALAAAGAAPAYDDSLRVETLAAGFEYPWSLAQLPDGSLLITEKPGRLLRLAADFRTRREVAGAPEVAWVGQGGLLDVLAWPGPGPPDGVRVLLSYSRPCATGFTTALGGYLLRDGELRDGRELFAAEPCGGLTWHFGGRLAAGADGMLYLTVGDRGERRHSQDLGSHWGKVLRLRPDGSVPDDNPFRGDPAARPEIYSYGHRNPQGMARHPDTGALWLHEHGPKGGDELNLLAPGANYGWPLATHGREYSGGAVSEHAELPGMASPVLHWTPSIAPSGLAICPDRGPCAAWRGQFLVGALKFQQLHRVWFEPDGAVREAVLPAPRGLRLRDVRALADGHIYLLTDEADGKLLRLVQ